MRVPFTCVLALLMPGASVCWVGHSGMQWPVQHTVPLCAEHIMLHYELTRAQETGNVVQAEQVSVALGEEESHEAFQEAWEAEDGADEGTASIDGLTGAQWRKNLLALCVDMSAMNGGTDMDNTYRCQRIRA